MQSRISLKVGFSLNIFISLRLSGKSNSSITKKPFDLRDLNKINKPQSVRLYNVNVDSCFDLFAFYKSKKVVKGIPDVMIYYPIDERDIDTFYIPDEFISGYDENQINEVFKNISDRLNNK